MKTVYTDLHTRHAPVHEFFFGKMTPYFEKPERAQYVHDAVAAMLRDGFVAPTHFSETDFTAVHDPGYVRFLREAHRLWKEAGYEGDAMGSAFNVQHPGAPVSGHIDGKLGIYTADCAVPLTATSWDAIEASAFTALTAQQLVAGGEKSAFALCRPPGHHATAACAAGYCFLNNAAIAVQKFIAGGAQRVAILDVDYHHGNGTQDIFYERDDVLFVSLHADPAVDYPYFAGHANETGRGRGAGFNVNYPMPHGTAYDVYGAALADGLKRIGAYAPDVLVVSLGVDTFEKDPISKFKLTTDDYARMGGAIAKAKKPTLFVLEGGYAVEEVGVNVANVLAGFEGT